MRNPKLMIRKRKQLDNKGHYRFYSVKTPEGIKVASIALNDYPDIRTEKDLLRLIYESWGGGEYLVSAVCQGRKGFFTFWRGMIDEKGFFFLKKEYDRKAIAEWDDILDLTDEDDKALLQNIKEEEKKKKKKQFYGFIPFLIPSGRRGQFNFWNDNSFSLKREESERGEDWGLSKKNSGDGWSPNVIKPEDWGADKSEDTIW